MNLIKAICLLTSGLLAAAPGAVFADFYVSPTGSDSNPGTLAAPFATVEKARQTVLGVNSGMSSDITIYLRGGTYFLINTLAFDPGDSGMNGHNVIYSSYPGETPVLSGGQQIPGPWTLGNGGIYHASVPAGFRFRQLYVNGARAIRARTPNVGTYNHVVLWTGPDWPSNNVPDGLDRHIDVNACDFPSCSVPSWNNLNKVEMVVSREWEQATMRISALSQSGGVIHVNFQTVDTSKGWAGHCDLREPDDQGCNTWNGGFTDPYYFENALEFLDSPGEFYLDESAGLVYYMPRSGENMTSAAVVAPAVQRLVGIVGSSGNPVHNLRFYGIVFEHATWLQPSDQGYASGQGDNDEVMTSAGETRVALPGAFHLEYADTIRLERNTLQFIGAAALELGWGCRNVAVIGNVIKDASAGGIDVAVDVDNNTISGDVVKNITIQNNYIAGIGRDYHSALGVQAHYATPILIDHNEVEDAAYSGIGIDWRGDDGASSSDLQITNNLIHNVMNLMADGGGIYTFWVNKPSTQISGNYVYSIHRSAFGGPYAHAALYLDEGTDYVTATNNVLTDADVILNTNWSGNPSASLHNIIGNNPSSDSTIQANAGIQAAYQDIKTVGANAADVMAPGAPKGLVLQ